MSWFALHPEAINRKGRPKKENSFPHILDKWGDKRFGVGSKTYKERVAAVLWQKASKGHMPAIKILANFYAVRQPNLTMQQANNILVMPSSLVKKYGIKTSSDNSKQ